MADPKILRATESFMAAGGTHVNIGDLFASDDPVVKGREHLFADAVAGVRVSAAVTGPVTAPPPFLPERPTGNASRDTWAAYVASFGADPGELTRDELKTLADTLESGD